MLAFGTDEGRIGTVNALSNRPSNFSLLDFKHRQTVYNLVWAPVCVSANAAETDQQLALYSCADNSVFALTVPGNQSVNVDTVVEETNKLGRSLHGVKR